MRLTGLLPLIALLDFKLKDIKPAHIRGIIKHFTDNGRSPKTIKNNVSMAHNIFLQAMQDGQPVKLPKQVKTPPDPFSVEEMLMIIEASKAQCPQLTAFFAIGFFTGIRTGEIMALTWEDIDLNRHKIMVSKTMTERQLKLGCCQIVAKSKI